MTDIRTRGNGAGPEFVAGMPLDAAKIDREALVVAMAVVPGVYSRNKMFKFFEDTRVRSARRRAAALRGAARHLASGAVCDVAVSDSECRGVVLSYRLGAVRLVRRLELSAVEYASVAYLARRGGSRALEATEKERALIDATLGRLAAGLNLSASETMVMEPPPG
jgi:hypothetical protein